MTFREFLEFTDTKPLGSIYQPSNVYTGVVPSAWTGTQAPVANFQDAAPIPPGQTDFDLELPSVTKTAQIKYMNEKRNPILVYLSDGTQLFLSHDEFRRIKGEPRIGKTITVVMQRRADDRSGLPSKIKDITVH